MTEAQGNVVIIFLALIAAFTFILVLRGWIGKN